MVLKIGDKVKIRKDNDNESYADFKNKTLIVTHVANKYMPSKEFFETGSPNGFHPGYDEGMSPQRLYDFETDQGEEVPFSLYDYEVRKVR